MTTAALIAVYAVGCFFCLDWGFRLGQKYAVNRIAEAMIENVKKMVKEDKGE